MSNSQINIILYTCFYGKEVENTFSRPSEEEKVREEELAGKEGGGQEEAGRREEMILVRGARERAAVGTTESRHDIVARDAIQLAGRSIESRGQGECLLVGSESEGTI